MEGVAVARSHVDTNTRDCCPMKSSPIQTTVVGSYPTPAWLAAYPTASHLRDALLVVLKTQEMAGIDVVFHLAAMPSVARSWVDPVMTLAVNAQGTANLVEAAVESGVAAFVYSSSSSVSSLICSSVSSVLLVSSSLWLLSPSRTIVGLISCCLLYCKCPMLHPKCLMSMLQSIKLQRGTLVSAETNNCFVKFKNDLHVHIEI